MTTKNYSLLGLCSVIACGAMANEAPKKATDKTPNVVFIIADDMGYADLACYGNLYTKTPNIDRLASQGVRFTQGYAGSAVSSPSRCTLLTGKHTGHSRVRNNFVEAGGVEGLKGKQTIRRQNITPQDTTIATMLKQQGYVSGVINKWHLDGFNPNAGPLDNGFDEFKGWLVSTGYSNDPYYYPEWRFDNRNLIKIKENENGVQARHNNDISTEEAIDFLDRHKSEKFFLYLAYDTPHEPYNIKETPLYDKYDWDDTSKKYASLISHMDNNIGKVLAKLDELKLAENTVVIFISDNGGASIAPHRTLRPNGILRGQKGNFYEGGIRVPVIIRTPDSQAGLTCDEPVYFPDIMPTIAELTSCKTPTDIDGKSILPLLTGSDMKLRERLLYWEFPGQTYAARLGQWKIIRPGRDKAVELYNIDNDISETTDLASKYPEIVERINNMAKSASVPSPNFTTPTF